MSDFIHSPEKRNHRRVDADVAVEMLIDGKKITATSSNISCGGMFIPLANHPLSLNKPVKLSFFLPGEQKNVQVSGEICRLESLQQGNSQDGVAVHFTGLYDENIHSIDRWIKKRMH